MPDSNTSVMFMPDDATAAPAAPKTYSREALVAKGMAKGWDKARAEAAADVKLAKETSKVWESAAPEEDFSAVAKRAGELVPDGYMAPEEVSSMPTLLPKREPLPLPASTPSGSRAAPAARPAPPTRVPDAATRALLAQRTPPDPLVATSGYDVMGNIPFAPGPELRAERYLRPMSSLTPQEVRAIDVAERAREDEAAKQAGEEASVTAKFMPPLGFAMGGPAGAALGVGFGAFAKPLAESSARLTTPKTPTETELAIRTTFDGAKPAPAAPPPASEEIAYTVPQTSVPSDMYDFAKERATDALFTSMAAPVAFSDVLMNIYKGAEEGVSAASDALSNTSWIVPAQKPQSLKREAELAVSWGSFPTQTSRERARSARMFQQRPEEIVPLGGYILDQNLFDVIDTPEGAVEKGLDKTPGFQMWEKEHPVRAQKAREVVATQKAERAPIEREAQREAVRKQTVEDYLSQGILPAIEKMKDYNLTQDEYRALQIAGSLTGRQTSEGDIELAGGDGGQRVREMLKLRKEEPDAFSALVAALPKGP